MESIFESFGELVFSDAVMRSRLPDDAYRALKDAIRLGKPLSEDVAGVVAGAMKDWAIEKGVTHFTHWFQPLTGVTAEKHEAFIAPAKDGSPIAAFSGQELTMGEPDASSFPSGGLRATFEARGYTAWDPTGYAFIKDGTLCIPTVFFSYSGEALDKKTPLLRSMELLNREALRVLNCIGEEATRVIPTTGAEQEYFLVKRSLYEQRRDLLFCSRTLFGAKPPKGQELEDHYFGAIGAGVADFMRDLDRELWKLGVYAKTEHKEVAPGQYELAPVFANTNTATDHNQLTMEIMRNTALRHGFVCLLHEKPFMRLNGSGKHNNWSLATEAGENLLDPGANPCENLRFLIFLCAVIKAVDEYHDLLRVCVASAGNDCRLGGQEAPPAIVSIFLGDELTGILDSIEEEGDYSSNGCHTIESGLNVMPRLSAHNTDRNRTSPFAFTGNKFEFRMVGASQSIADANIVLNTIVGQALSEFADELERTQNKEEAAKALLRRELKAHKRILYNGNCYSEEWKKEAAERGLYVLPTTADALPRLIDKKNVELYTRHGIFSERELHSRYEIQLESYVKVISIEAKTMLEMTHRDILPAVIAYEAELSSAASKKALLFVSNTAETALLKRMTALTDALYQSADALDKKLDFVKAATDVLEAAKLCKDSMLPAMAELREIADKLEVVTSRKHWPFPTYEELLYSL
ncbi:MAG TPA: glutamine synthetase III [Clostridia bacterium]|nr:glutamine synthetase III [Clostridia bacterium]